MSQRSRVYFLLVVGGAAAQLVLLNWKDGLETLPREHLLGLAVLVIIGILGEALSYSYKIGQNGASSSVAFVPILATAVLFSAEAATACAITIVLVTQTAIARREAWKVMFNAGQVVLATAAAAELYNVFPRTDEGIALAGFFLAALVFFVINQACVGGFIAVAQQKPVLATLKHMMGGGGSNIFFDVLVSPIALVVAIFYRDYAVGGLLVIALPLLLVRHAYLSKLQVQHASRDLIKVLIKAIETRDPYTSGHSVRVSMLARAIAQDLRLSRIKADAIETAALLHDIGKIDGVYARIISKPHALDSHERRIIRTHAVKGAEFLRSLSSFGETVILGVKHHHERFDGTGYPDGLAGDDIPIAARVIMLCDSIDAMLSDRPYRKALPIPVVLAELESHAGTQFDPHIVQVVISSGTLGRAVTLIKEWEAPESVPPDLPRYRLHSPLSA